MRVRNEPSISARVQRVRRLACLLSIGMVALLAPQSAYAAAGVERPESWLGVPSWVWAWANLFVIWAIILKFLGPPIRKAMVERKQAVEESIKQAKWQREEAKQMSARLEQQVEELKEQMDDLVQRSVKEGEAEHQRILEQAEAEAVRVLDQASSEIRNRTAQARSELRAYAAELAAELASQRVADQLTVEDRRRIFDENLRRFGEQIS